MANMFADHFSTVFNSCDLDSAKVIFPDYNDSSIKLKYLCFTEEDFVDANKENHMYARCSAWT